MHGVRAADHLGEAIGVGAQHRHVRVHGQVAAAAAGHDRAAPQPEHREEIHGRDVPFELHHVGPHPGKRQAEGEQPPAAPVAPKQGGWDAPDLAHEPDQPAGRPQPHRYRVQSHRRSREIASSSTPGTVASRSSTRFEATVTRRPSGPPGPRACCAGRSRAATGCRPPAGAALGRSRIEGCAEQPLVLRQVIGEGPAALAEQGLFAHLGRAGQGRLRAAPGLRPSLAGPGGRRSGPRPRGAREHGRWPRRARRAGGRCPARSAGVVSVTAGST